MPAQIRPNRLEVNDRFPMLGFTLRSTDGARRAEVAVATHPELLAPEAKSRRTDGNFYSSRAGGPLALPRGEAVYVLPPEVLARFVGQDRLYFGLATAVNGAGAFEIDVMPTLASPYVSLIALTGRSLRRVRVMPSRTRAPGEGALAWAGDSARPGQTPAAGTAPANGAAPVNGGQPATAAPAYDDGYGPLPERPGEPAAAPASATPVSEPALANPAAAARGMSVGPQPVRRAAARAMAEPSVDAGRTPVMPPSSSVLGSVARAAAEVALLTLTGPLAPMIIAIRLAARASAATGNPVSIGLGPSAGAGLGAGGTLGYGLVFGPGGELGVYGSAQFDVGFVLSASVSIQITVVKGGIESFSGWNTAATVSGGEGIVGGASALFDTHGNFQGVSAQVGIGAGFSPVDFYVSVQRGVATSFGMAAALGQLAPARAMSSDPLNVEVKYRTFIPSPAVKGPLDLFGGEGFDGDGRGFAYAGGSSRGEIVANIQLMPDGRIERIDLPVAHWGQSGSYANSDLVEAAGQPDWWRNLRPGAVAKEHATLARTTANLDVKRDPRPGGEKSVRIFASGKNPLFMGAPAIDAAIEIEFDVNMYGEVRARVSGAHDGFPAHELYINGASFWQHDPVAKGETPWALVDPLDVEFTVDWRTVATLPAATGQSLGVAPRTRAFDAEIPLDPGVGGMSIGMDALQVGDIILSTGDAAISRAIRAATSGAVSHAMLYVGQGGQVVEAVGEGVVLRPLSDAIADAMVAVAFRAPDLDRAARQTIADEAGRHIGQPYNHVGIARQAAFQVDRALCAALPNGLSDRCRAFAGRIDMGTATNDSFFCSELVLEAYRAAGHPLTITPPNWASPQDLAELRFDYSKLRYVGHLKAAPSGGLFGHLLAYAKSVPRPAPAPRALSGQSFSINWDDVELQPQSSGTNCWAAAAAMVVAWNDRVSLDQSVLHRAGTACSFNGQADVASNERFAREIGLVAEAPADYNVEGFRTLLENYGPLWVGKVMGSTPPWSASSHAVVVTGMYADGDEAFVRVTDPWDRLVGRPGAPGAYQRTHATGSRYIMRFDDFMAEYDADQMGAAELHTMILRSPDTSGRQPNRGSPPPGYAQSLSARRMAPPAPTWGAARGLTVGDAPGVTRRVVTTEAGGVRFSLEQVDGMRLPTTAKMLEAPRLPATLTIDDWPRMPDENGATRAAIAVAWTHAGGAVGEVRVTPSTAAVADGWALAVEGRTLNGPDDGTTAVLALELVYHFTKQGEADHRALITVTLKGDGRHERVNAWEPQTARVGS